LPIVMVVCSLYCARREDTIVPSAVTKRAAFGRRQACGEGAEQQRRGQPKRQMRRAAPRIVGGGLGFGNDLVDAFLGIGLTHARACGDDLCDVGSIARREAFAAAEVGGPQPQDFRAALQRAG
jgi:hypothetical protein